MANHPCVFPENRPIGKQTLPLHKYQILFLSSQPVHILCFYVTYITKPCSQKNNPLDMPPHEQPKNITEAEIGGLGINLIKHYMEECHYQRRNDKNYLTLSSYITSGESVKS